MFKEGKIFKKGLVILITALFLISMVFFVFPGKVYGDVTSKNYGDVNLSGGFDSGSFSDVWDLTKGDLTISFIYDANGLKDTSGAHAWAELGIRDNTITNNFNPNNKGIWLSTDYDWTVNTFAPDPVGNPKLDMDDKLILQKQSGIGEGGYNLPSIPPVPGNNHRFWWDRDGVDPYQNGETANTSGIYNISIILHATDTNSGTAYMKINGLNQGFETDGNWNTIELTPAGMTFTADMTQIQIFYGLYGYGATHSILFKNITVTGFIIEDTQIVQPAASSRPLTAEEQVALNLSLTQQVDLYGANNTGFIKTFYDNILSRVADEKGLEDWMNALKNGMTPGQLVYDLVFSDELNTKIAAFSNEEFVNFLYENVLNREPDSDGFNNWVSLMGSGMSKEDVLLHFLDTQEFKDILIMFGLE